MRTSFFWGIALFLLLLASCNDSRKAYNDKFPFLDSLGITITDQLLLGDTLTLPDVYCGDPNQKMSDLKGWENEISSYFQVTSIPHTVVVDKNGKILRRGLRSEQLGVLLQDLLK